MNNNTNSKSVQNQEILHNPSNNHIQKYTKQLLTHLYFIGFGIFILIIYKQNWPKIGKILLSVDFNYIIAAFILRIISVILIFKRFSIITSIYEKIPFQKIFTASVIGGIYSYFMPAKLGEGLKAPILKENSTMNYRELFFTIIFDKLFDLMLVLTCGLIGLMFMHNILNFEPKYFIGFVILCLLILLGIIIVTVQALHNENLHKFLIKIGTWKIEIGQYLKAIKETISPLLKSNRAYEILLWANIYNLIAYFITFCAIYLVMIAVGANLNFFVAMTIYSIVLFTNMIPISISGIGTRDVTLIFFFSALGFETEQAITMSMLDLIILNYGVFLFLFCLIGVGKIIKNRSFKKMYWAVL